MKPDSKKNKVAAIVGLGFAVSSELFVAALGGYYLGEWAVKEYGLSTAAPGLFAVTFLFVALFHAVYLIRRLS